MLGFHSGSYAFRGFAHVFNASNHSLELIEIAMFPAMPLESLVSALQFVCYFFVMLAALLGCTLVRS